MSRPGDTADTALSLLLRRPIAYHRAFVRLGAGITGAVMLSQALYWQPRHTSQDGWWWKTQDDWAAETGMSRRELETARQKLVAANVLEYERRGVPAKGWYRVVEADVANALSRLAESANLPENKEKKKEKNAQPRLAESANQDCTDQPSKDGGKSQCNTESTAETTRSSSTAAAAGGGKQKATTDDCRGPRTSHECADWGPRDEAEIRDAINVHGVEDVELRALEHRRTGVGLDKYGQPLISHVRAALDASARKTKPSVPLQTPSPTREEPHWLNNLRWANKHRDYGSIDEAEYQRLLAEALAERDRAPDGYSDDQALAG